MVMQDTTISTEQMEKLRQEGSHDLLKVRLINTERQALTP